jgi:H+/Cl- antiporter ClcA
VTAIFLKLLLWGTTAGQSHRYFFVLLPVALFLSALLIKLAPDAKGHGTEKVIEAVHRHAGKIKAMVVPVKLAATLITLFSWRLCRKGGTLRPDRGRGVVHGRRFAEV